WLVGQKLGLALGDAENQMIDAAFEHLIRNALAQPQVCVHRDYHSRNLLLTASDEIAVLDFQDAVQGPFTYDLVSLLRDCYVQWPLDQVRGWALYYREQAQTQGLAQVEEAE